MMQRACAKPGIPDARPAALTVAEPHPCSRFEAQRQGAPMRYSYVAMTELGDTRSADAASA